MFVNGSSEAIEQAKNVKDEDIAKYGRIMREKCKWLAVSVSIGVTAIVIILIALRHV